MSRPESNLRLFVAAYPPEDAARSMLRLLRKADLPDHRATPLEQVHLTIQFIGDTPAKDLERVIESVERSASGLRRFDLAPEHLVSLPQRGPARLVALETDAPAPLRELHRRLVTRLANAVRSKLDERFLPHFTLCRFRRPRMMEPIRQALELEPFAVPRIVLMRSVLGPQGAVHHEVARFELEE
jgi:2'-5' RNA ligase